MACLTTGVVFVVVRVIASYAMLRGVTWPWRRNRREEACGAITGTWDPAEGGERG